jgi:acyl-coenzyme A synthetase/AMP-(fatty) acid ligase
LIVKSPSRALKEGHRDALFLQISDVKGWCMSELAQLAANALARPASQPAIEFARSWINWGDLRQLAERVAALLAAGNVAPGAKVALVARNHPSAIAAFVGLIAQAYSIRMIYPFQSNAGIAREVDLLEPAAVIAAEADLADRLLEVLGSKGIAGIALRDMDAFSAPGCESSRISSEAGSAPEIQILTSGTTGKPKPFVLSYDMVMRDIVGASVVPARADPAELAPILLYFPVGNISGLYTTLPAVLGGRRSVLLERFSVEAWHDYVLRYRPTSGGLPPAGIRMVLDAALPKEDLSSLRALGAGAAPLDPETQQAFEQRYGIPILLSYGATEFGGPVTRMTPELHAAFGKQKVGSVGKALPGVKLRVIDPDTFVELPAGQEGLLEVISPRIGPDWIRTSDIAKIDADGFMYHCGRADGAIMRGGFKVLPETIERALSLHPAVSAAAVVGIADHRLGQVPAAAIVLKPDTTAGSEELAAHVRNHVLATHIPVRWKIIAELPRTKLSFKVDQSAVRKLFEND